MARDSPAGRPGRHGPDGCSGRGAPLTGLRALLPALVALLAGAPLPAAADARGLADDLREGGHVIYFRHAATDWSQRDRVTGPGDWTSCDPGEMRQLSDAGRRQARSVGAAMRALGIPVGAVHASEYCRCVETAELLDLGRVETTRDLLNARAAQYVGGREALKGAARRRLATPPPPGTNTVLVAHGNVFLLAAGERPPEGGAVVVRPRGGRDFRVLGTVTAADWIALAGDP